MARTATPPVLPAAVVAFLPRDRGRALLRAALPRRRVRLTIAHTPEAFAATLRTHFADAAIVHVSGGEEGWRAAPLARGLPSVPFFALVSPVPHDAAAVARAADDGFADLVVEGVDDAALADLVDARGFTARFVRALAEPPDALRLTSALQRRVWRDVVGRAGRAVTTGELAARVGVSREHLSRTFAAGGAPTLKRVIDLVRLCSAAELAKNPAFDSADVARVLGFASSSHLSATAQRVVDTRSSSLARLRTVDLVERFAALRRA